MINDALVELEATDEKYNKPSQDEDLVSWLNELTEPWRQYRDTNFKTRWAEYYRLWRGIFKESDKTRKSERSKLISPALQQAIESTCAELEEATFGKGRWFDISEDVMEAADDTQRAQLEGVRKRLNEDMNRAGHREASSEVFLLGTIFGTGIGKISVDKIKDFTLNEDLQLIEQEKWSVGLTAVEPMDFLIDPTARNVDDSIGCVHETEVPRVDVLSKMHEGIYKKINLGEDESAKNDENEPSKNHSIGKTKLFEYHGLVPESLLPPEVAADEEFEDLAPVINNEAATKIDIIGDTLVEAIVVVANGDKLIKAVRNPLPRGDRAFIAYQHDTVPNRFWGRGTAEKGYNPQKALDAELRGRIDAMAFAVHPMLAADATKLPRGGRLEVEAGKTILTNGDPRTAFMPFNFGSVNPSSFPQSQDLERMVQMGTGAVDMSQAGAQGMIGATVGGMGMLTAATIKRTKRTLANIERQFISPLVHKTAWRYMYFDRERYPIPDMKFTVHASLGMMAKEIEQQQFSNLLKTVPTESPAYWMLLKGVYENSSISNKDAMIPIIDQMMQQALQPKEPPPDPMIEVTREDIASRERIANNRARIDLMRVRSELLRARIAMNQADADEANTDADTALKLAKAEGEELGSQLTAYLQEVDSMKDKSTEDNDNDTELGQDTDSAIS